MIEAVQRREFVQAPVAGLVPEPEPEPMAWVLLVKEEECSIAPEAPIGTLAELGLPRLGFLLQLWLMSFDQAKCLSAAAGSHRSSTGPLENRMENTVVFLQLIQICRPY